MSATLVLITTLAIAVTLACFFVRLRLRALIHPGTYFLVIWLLAVPGYYFSATSGIFPLYYPRYADELTGYVLFTTLCFFAFLWRKPAAVKFGANTIDYFRTERIFLQCAGVVLVTALLLWIKSGAHFNIGVARLEILKDYLDINYQPTPMDTVGALIAQLNTPLSIYAGYELLRRMAGEPGMIRKARNLAIPFLTAVVYAFTIGGRNPIAANIKLYLLGMGFAAIYHMPRGVYQKFMRYALAVIVAFGLFSTFVADSRSKAFGTETRKALYSSSTMARFSGVIDYMSCHYVGYQLRRVDWLYDAPTYGTETFNGFFSVGVPFASTLGIRSATVGELVGVKPFDKLQVSLNDDREDFGTSTASIYMNMYHDFGHYGTYVFIQLFVFFTQRCFEGYLSRRITAMSSIYFYFLLLSYWGSSNFSSSFMVEGILYTYVLLYLYDLLLGNRSLKRSLTCPT